MKTIETRKLSDKDIELLESYTAVDLENKYKTRDCIYFPGISFIMVFYSHDCLPNGQSNSVTYWSELYDAEINLDWIENTVSVNTPAGIDWKKQGF